MPTPDQRKYKSIIVDDKELDRLALHSFVRRYPFIEVVGVFSAAAPALEFIRSNGAPEVLFLDIDMPGMDGLEMRQQLQQVPACVFVTAHPEFAIEGFELAALDYVVKPLKAERVQKMMHRLEEYLGLHFRAEQPDHTLGEHSVVIKDGYNQVKLQLNDIVYLEALKDYTGIVTRERKYCVLSPLGGLLKEKAFQDFVRIHRSYAIQKQSIREVSSKGVRVNETILPIGRSYKDIVEKLLST